MNAGKICPLGLVLLCLFCWQGRPAAQSRIDLPEKRAAETEAEYNLIHLGDLIEIDVVGTLDYDWRGNLNPEGYLVGLEGVEESIYALCRTEQEVAREVAERLGKTLRDPDVVVRILDRSSRPASTVYGAVRVAQRFQIRRAVQLNELLVLSGGLTEKASGEIQIFRPASLSCAGGRKPPPTANGAGAVSAENERFISASQSSGPQLITIKIAELLAGKQESNPQILSGDVVTVLESQPVYVIGGVVTPKQIATRSALTVSRAVASAGGLTKDADPTRVTIFRRAGRETAIIEVDLEKIKAGQAEDPVLQSFDVIEVLQRGREKRKYAPVVRAEEQSESNAAKLPLRVID